MKFALFVTGFNNWGKTTLLRSIFESDRFYGRRSYNVLGLAEDFSVFHHSNDDPTPGDGERHNWLHDMEHRLADAPNGNHLFSALCPSIEPNNDFRILLRDPFIQQYDRIVLFLVEHKWDSHARLEIETIEQAASAIPNVTCIHIDAHDPEDNANDLQRKSRQIREHVEELMQAQAT